MNIQALSKKIRARKKIILLLSVILAVGFFLRTYNFHDWLHFEIDQVYDITIVSKAVENGIGNLPLLGPTAGGGRALRLGPAFYYMEYLSAKIFGDNPTGNAMLVLLCNLASLPVFYLFCRRYFSQFISLGLLAVFSVSFYGVMYSRFSWSPNVLPFLILLSFYSLLKSTEQKQQHKEKWFLLSVLAISITTQIHFNAFFTMPAIVVAYLIYKRPHFSWKTWLGAIGIFLAVYSPMIVSDIKTGGENSAFFKNKLLKSSGGQKLTNAGVVLKDLQQNGFGYLFIVSGQGEISNRTIDNFEIFDFALPKKEIAFNLASFVFIALGALLLLKSVVTEKESSKKDFLVISGLWFFFSLAYFYTILSGYRMYPRFFLLISPLAVIFLGIIISSIKLKNARLNIALLSAMFLLFVSSNLSKDFGYFNQMRQGEKGPLPQLEIEDVFPNTARITLNQQKGIVSYIAKIHQQNGYPVYLSATTEYKPAFWYDLNKVGIQYYEDMSDKKIYQEANYFIITRSDAKMSANKNLFNLIDTKYFGSLVVYRIQGKPEAITAQRQSESSRNIRDEQQKISELLTWNKLF